MSISAVKGMVAFYASQGRQQAQQASRQQSQQVSQNNEREAAKAMQSAEAHAKKMAESTYTVSIDTNAQPTKPAMNNMSPWLQTYVRMQNT